MKRPEGFDRPTPARQGDESAQRRGNAKPKKSAARQPAASKAPSRKAGTRKPVAQKPPSQPRLAKLSAVRPKQAGQEATGAERKDVRRAARKRRRFEKSEIKRFTRRSRHRRFGWLALTGTVLGLAGLIAVAVYSPLLALRTVQIDGASAVSADEVKNAIDSQLGTPLALLDYDRIRQDLNAFPLIRSYVTEVVPPNTLVVHLVERSPVGTIARGSSFVLVDPAGVELGSSATRVAGVPLITVGADGTDGVAFRSVAEVLLALPASIRSKVDTAGASSKDDVTLVLTGAHQRVVWGSAERSALKARVLTELLAARPDAGAIEYDVSAPLSPVVRG